MNNVVCSNGKLIIKIVYNFEEIIYYLELNSMFLGCFLKMIYYIKSCKKNVDFLNYRDYNIFLKIFFGLKKRKIRYIMFEMYGIWGKRGLIGFFGCIS